MITIPVRQLSGRLLAYPSHEFLSVRHLARASFETLMLAIRFHSLLATLRLRFLLLVMLRSDAELGRALVFQYAN